MNSNLNDSEESVSPVEDLTEFLNVKFQIRKRCPGVSPVEDLTTSDLQLMLCRAGCHWEDI